MCNRGQLPEEHEKDVEVVMKPVATCVTLFLILALTTRGTVARGGWRERKLTYMTRRAPDGSLHRRYAQSPVDITGKRKCHEEPMLCTRWSTTSFFRHWNLTNTGELVVMRPEPPRSVYLYALVGQAKKRLAVEYIHLKWGAANRGSEHTIDGRYYQAEMQVFHHSSIGSRKKHAMAYMIKERSSATNFNWQPMIAALKDIKYTARRNTVSLRNVDINSLLGDSSERGHREESIRRLSVHYQGSTTTGRRMPIDWAVFTTPIELASSQLRVLRSMRRTDGTPITSNVRPITWTKRPPCQSLVEVKWT